jgi:hypothetical protein
MRSALAPLARSQDASRSENETHAGWPGYLPNGLRKAPLASKRISLPLQRKVPADVNFLEKTAKEN